MLDVTSIELYISILDLNFMSMLRSSRPTLSEMIPKAKGFAVNQS